MTTTEDRIIAEKDGSFTINVEESPPHIVSGGASVMNNEPVAWMHPETLECGHGGNVDWEDTGCIPLYTHPVKELTAQEVMEQTHRKISEAHWKVKELTDEEIWEVIDNCFGVHAFNLDYQIALDEAREDAFELVKAILRKASEK